MTTWPITCGLAYLSFRGKIRPPKWIQRRVHPFIAKYPSLSLMVKNRPLAAASILTITTPINRLFLPLHLWIMIKYGNDIISILDRHSTVRLLREYIRYIQLYIAHFILSDIKYIPLIYVFLYRSL